MRKILLFVLVICTVYSSFGQETKVGLLFDQFASSRWQKDAKYLETYFQDLGVETITKVAHSSLETQTTQAKELILSGVDALVLVAVDGTGCKDILDMSVKKGVPVIAYERPIMDERIDFYVSYDSYDVGKKQAESMLANVSEGNIIMINGPISDVNAIQFRKAQLDVLKPHVESGKIKIVQDLVLDSWSEMDALVKLHELAIDFTEINGVLAAADRFNNAVIEYLGNDEPLKSIYTTGQSPAEDMVGKMEADIQNMTIIKPIKPQAKKTAELTISRLKGEALKLPTITIGEISFKGYLFSPIVINKDNLDVFRTLLNE